MSRRRVWPYLGPVERVLFVVLFPLVLLAWASCWIVCGVPLALRRVPR